jgi:hypothetical protein
MSEHRLRYGVLVYRITPFLSIKYDITLDVDRGTGAVALRGGSVSGFPSFELWGYGLLGNQLIWSHVQGSFSQLHGAASVFVPWSGFGRPLSSNIPWWWW